MAGAPKTEGLHRYMAWDASFYDSTTRFFPHAHEVHGPFLAADEVSLKEQLLEAGLDLPAVRWERKPAGNAEAQL